MKKRYFILFLLMIPFNFSNAQTTEDLLNAITNQIDNQRTGNSKDILATLFRVGIDNLLGSDKSFTFNTTLYGIDSTLNAKSASSLDLLYYKQRMLRNIQLNGGVTSNNNNEISTITAGFKVALINKKDITYADFSALIPTINNFENLRKALNLEIAALYPDVATLERIQTSWREYDKSHDYSKLDPLIKETLQTRSPEEEALIEADDVHRGFVNLAAIYSRKPLLTLAPNFSYDRLGHQPEYSLAGNFTIGLGKDFNKKPWELEAKALLSIKKDTLMEGSNLKNQLLAFSSGLNKVFRENNEKEPTLELKGYFQYEHQFGTLQIGEEANRYTFNSTLRINIYKTLWIPLTLSYDIENPNLWGFLSLTANIDRGDLNKKE